MNSAKQPAIPQIWFIDPNPQLVHSFQELDQLGYLVKIISDDHVFFDLLNDFDLNVMENGKEPDPVCVLLGDGVRSKANPNVLLGPETVIQQLMLYRVTGQIVAITADLRVRDFLVTQAEFLLMYGLRVEDDLTFLQRCAPIAEGSGARIELG